MDSAAILWTDLEQDVSPERYSENARMIRGGDASVMALLYSRFCVLVAVVQPLYWTDFHARNAVTFDFVSR